MNTTKYKATTAYSPRIDVVVVDRDSDSSVWIKGRRLRKFSSYESYFDNFQEAKSHLIAFATGEVTAANARLDYKNKILLETHGLVAAV